MRARLMPLLAVTLLTAAACDEPQGCSGAACLLEAFPALGPTVVEGGPLGVELLAGVTGLEPQDVPLAEIGPLSAEQEALLGCGPYWGTDCRRHGIDLRNADAGVLQQAWVGYAGTHTGFGRMSFVLISTDGTRVPDPVYEDGLVTPVIPSLGGQFASEMAALSYNLQLLLIAFSSQGTGAKDEFDPSNPFAFYDPSDPDTEPFRGQCSFAQPQYCKAIQSVFDIVFPDPSGTCPAVLPGGREARGTTVMGFVRLPRGTQPRWSLESCGTPPTVILPGRGASQPGGVGGTQPGCSITSPHLCSSVQQLLLQARNGRRSALRGCTNGEPAVGVSRRGRC